jgi:hypothetical protein
MMAALLLANTPVLPHAEMIPAFFTGDRLLEVCMEPNDGRCAMYVAGVLDGVFHAQADAHDRSICGGNELDTREASRLVVQFLQDRPELRSKAAAVVVDLALRSRLPCPEVVSDAG